MASQKARRPSSVDCSSRPSGRRANKRRFVNLLQQLGGAFGVQDRQAACRGLRRRRADGLNYPFPSSLGNLKFAFIAPTQDVAKPVHLGLYGFELLVETMLMFG
jgi:hypothetical protein